MVASTVGTTDVTTMEMTSDSGIVLVVAILAPTT